LYEIEEFVASAWLLAFSPAQRLVTTVFSWHHSAVGDPQPSSCRSLDTFMKMAMQAAFRELFIYLSIFLFI
jgi:hypothetical protein